MDITTTDAFNDLKLAEIVRMYPGAAQIFNRYGVDYCCGGGRTLNEALDGESGDWGTLLSDLQEGYAEFMKSPGELADWESAGPGALIDHILRVHHRFAWRELEVIDELLPVVLRAHMSASGEELLEVHKTFSALRAELQEHLLKEEEIIFPLLDDVSAAGKEKSRRLIRETEAEHDAAGELLHRLKQRTNGFNPPENACDAFRELYRRLEALAEDTFAHVHLENNVLFPMIVG